MIRLGILGNAASTIIIAGLLLALTSLYLFSSRLPTNVKTNAPSLPGYVHFMDTHLGKVSVRVIGETGQAVVCLPGVNPALVDEWVYTAKAISEHGYKVFIINFHSNPNTKPAVLYGDISSDDVNKIIATLMDEVMKTERVILMGKSWGGGKAMQFVEKHPEKVSTLCLVAPASSDTQLIGAVQESKIPVLLAWAKDDSALWFSSTETWKAMLGEQLKLIVAEKGGHRILPEYTPKFIEFLQLSSKSSQ